MILPALPPIACAAAFVLLVGVALLLWLGLRRSRGPTAERRAGARRRVTPLDDDLGPLDEEVAIRLLVLTAHVLGRDLASRDAADSVAVLESLYGPLPDEADDATLRRRALVTLLGAETQRGADASRTWRRRAKATGEVMAENGSLDPFPLYMAVVEATTARLETGNYRDITRNGVETVRRDAPAAARALRLPSTVVDAHSEFVYALTLEQVAARCSPLAARQPLR